MPFSVYIFDLDGTLLDTLPDLVRLTNMVLSEHGWPEHSSNEILSYVGDGGRILLKRAAPPNTPERDIEETFQRWQTLYPTYGHELTQPYDGVPEMLASLKERGAKLGVLSNKFDKAARQVVADHFPGVFDLVRGECEDIPRKPDPTGLKLMMKKLGSTPGTTVYIGDSPSDIAVAKNAGTVGVAVTWGYRTSKSLLAESPDYLVSTPEELLSLS